jgi:uncharacterized protein
MPNSIKNGKRVLFDLVHPADVHFFKHAIQSLKEAGAKVLVVSRDKDITSDLLDELGIEHTLISQKKSGVFGAIVELLARNYRLWRLARDFQPDLMVANNSPCAAQVAWSQGRRSIVFEDTEINRFNHRLYYPFASEVHTPQCYRINLGPKQHRYPGYHPLAYLHPNHFRAHAKVHQRLDFEPGQKLIIIRFVRHDALHDVGQAGLSVEDKLALVEAMRAYGKVAVSAEISLPPGLEPDVALLSLAEIHHLMAFADLVIGESATMCAEAACLGTPSILLDEKGRGYIDDQARRYNLASCFLPQDLERALERAHSILSAGGGIDGAKNCDVYEKNDELKHLLEDMIDVSKYQLAQIWRLIGNSKL